MDEGLIQAPINIPAVPRRAREDGSSGLGRDRDSPESYAWIEPRGRKSEDTVSQEGTLQKPFQERVVRRWSIPAHLKSPHKHPVLNGMRETESQEQVTQPVPLASIASIRGRLTGRVMAGTPHAAPAYVATCSLRNTTQPRRAPGPTPRGTHSRPTGRKLTTPG
jgi:hypothetical protein